MTTQTKTKPAAGPQPQAGGGDPVPLDGAVLTITGPANNAVVPANTDLTVTVTTTRIDLNHEVDLLDGNGTVVATIAVPAPGASPFTATIPKAELPANASFTIVASVAAGQGTGHGTASAAITTGAATNA